DEAVVERDRDPDVDLVRLEETVGRPDPVELRVRSQRRGTGEDERGRHRHARLAVGLVERRQAIAGGVHPDLPLDVEVRRLLLALHHPAGDPGAHARLLDDPPVHCSLSMIAIGVPTSASDPAPHRISTSVPEAIASISTVVLSVSISAIGSPRSTVSPTCFSHEPTLPLSMS